MKRRNNRYIQVLLTYYRQTTFWFLTTWLIVLPVFIRGMDHSDKFKAGHTKLSWFGYIIELFVFLSCWLLPAAWGAILILHVREQLRSWRNILMPGYRAPHLIIAAIFFILAAAILCVEIHWGINQESFFYSLLMVITIMTASAWWASFGSQRLSLLLGPWFGLIPIVLISIINSYLSDPGSWSYVYYSHSTTVKIYEISINVILPLALTFSLAALGSRLAMMGKRGAWSFRQDRNNRRSLKELADSMIQVLLIYIHRPMFRRLLAWPMAFFFFLILLDRFTENGNYYFYSYYNAGFLFYPYNIDRVLLSQFLYDFIGALSLGFILFLPAAWGAVLATHVRKQFELMRNILIPGNRIPELAVAGLVFVFIALLLTLFNTIIAIPQLEFYDLYRYNNNDNWIFYGFFGSLLLILGTMTASAWWAFFKPQRLALFLGIMAALIPIAIWDNLIYYFYQPILQHFYSSSNYELAWDYTDFMASFISRAQEFFPFIFLLLLVLLGFRLARDTQRTKNRELTIKTELPFQTEVASRQPAAGFWKRSQLRRVSVLGPKAAWLVAGFSAAGLLLLILPGDNSLWRNLIINVCFILITITPSIAIALMWRERWPLLSMEYLYPVRRPVFIHEMAMALAFDFAEFWVALTVVTLIPLTIFSPSVLWDPLLWIGLAASAMMQLLAYGTMALALSFRSWAILLLALLLTLGWMIFPSASNLQVDSPLSVSIAIHSALTALPVGVILAFVAYFRWRRMSLA